MRSLLVLVLLVGTAAATPETVLKIEGSEIKATVYGSAKVEPLVLRELYLDEEKAYPATSVRAFLDGPAVAIAFVIHGQDFTMLGHDGDEDVPELRGMLTPLRAAFDRLALRAQLPPHSEVAVITYANTAEVKAPWMPAELLKGDALGQADDYRNVIGSELLAGVVVAFDELAKRSQGRKVMIVIGDGNDADNGNARDELARLVNRWPDVLVIGLEVKSAISADTSVIDALTPNHERVSIDGLEAGVKTAIDTVTTQFDATFDLKRFPRDGKSHTYAVMHGYDELGSARLDMPPPPVVPPHGQTWRWLTLGAVMLGFAGAAALVFRARASR